MSPQLSRLLETYRSSLLVAATRRGGDATIAEDMLQDAWIKLAERRISNADIVHPRAFLGRMVGNAAADHGRKLRRRAEIDAEIHGLLWDDDDGFSPERLLIGRQALAAARDVIADMPERTREIFVMHRFEGMTHKAIATALGISEQAVHYHIRRTLERLALMREHLPDLE